VTVIAAPDDFSGVSVPSRIPFFSWFDSPDQMRVRTSMTGSELWGDFKSGDQVGNCLQGFSVF